MKNGKDSGNYYLDNNNLTREIIDFKKTGFASEKLGKYLLLIANNLSSKGNFHGYTWKHDMVSEAVLTCIKYLRNFKAGKTNAFAYVTQICRHSFIAYIKQEHKHSEIKNTCYKIHDDLMDIHNDNNNNGTNSEFKNNHKIAIDYQQFGQKRKKNKKN